MTRPGAMVHGVRAAGIPQAPERGGSEAGEMRKIRGDFGDCAVQQRRDGLQYYYSSLTLRCDSVFQQSSTERLWPRANRGRMPRSTSRSRN